MKQKVIPALFFILVLSFQHIYPQEKGFTIRGIVRDENGNPMQGTAISIIKTLKGTFSGFDGSYYLRVDTIGVYIIRFSYTGYEPIEKKISVPDTLIADAMLTPRFKRTEEVIVSATRAGARTPMTFSSVSPDEIKESNITQDIPYLLGLTPSLVETSEEGTGIGYTGFRVRGTDASRINITLDGIPLNDAESQQVFWVDLPDLASSIDNIQVQRGVGTSSNGAGAFGASVNMQSKSPENLPFAEVNSSAGSFNTIKNSISAGTGLISDRFAIQFRYSDLKSDGYIKRTGANNRAYALSGIYKTDKSFLKINILSGQEHTGISWWGVPSEMLNTDRRYNPAGEYTDANGNTQYYDNESDNYTQTHYQIIYGLNLGRYTGFHAALHYTRGAGYYEEYRQDQPYSDYGMMPVTIDSVTLLTTDLIRRKWMRNNFYGLIYSLEYEKNKITAVAGGGINYYDGHHFGQIIWMRTAGNTEKDYQWYLNTAQKGEYNIYGKINCKLNQRLSVFGDMQYRHIFYKMAGPDDDLRDISQNHYFDFLNPKAGLFLTIKPNQSAYLSFSVAHKEPTRSDFKDASGDIRVTPRPETLYDAEAGYNLRGTRAGIGISLYGMFYDDQLVPTGQLSNVGYPIMTNVRQSYREGIEFNFDLLPVRKLDFKLSTTLSTNKIKGFTEYYTDYLSDGTSQYLGKTLGTTTIAYSPSVISSGDIGYSFTDRINIHLISKFVGRQYFDNTMSTLRSVDPYFVSNFSFNISIPVKRIRSFEFRMLINNLFNNLYSNNAYGGLWYEDGTEKTWAYYFPQAGRNFTVNVDIKF
jgi:iron complex outermembrane receptor protein